MANLHINLNFFLKLVTFTPIYFKFITCFVLSNDSLQRDGFLEMVIILNLNSNFPDEPACYRNSTIFQN